MAENNHGVSEARKTPGSKTKGKQPAGVSHPATRSGGRKRPTETVLGAERKVKQRLERELQELKDTRSEVNNNAPAMATTEQIKGLIEQGNKTLRDDLSAQVTNAVAKIADKLE